MELFQVYYALLAGKGSPPWLIEKGNGLRDMIIDTAMKDGDDRKQLAISNIQ